jgi:hypothetical protein
MARWFSGWRWLIWALVAILVLTLVLSYTLTGGSVNER